MPTQRCNSNKSHAIVTSDDVLSQWYALMLGRVTRKSTIVP